MSELTRLMKETNEALIRCGATVEAGARLSLERAERERVEKSLRAQLAAQHDETREARAEVDRLRGALKRHRFMLEAVDTLVEVEQRHVDHDYEHKAGEAYEDCSACRWHNVLRDIRAALKETP